LTARRVIARLDLKNSDVVKGIQLEGLRKVGNPAELAEKYTSDGADELVLTDVVASLYNRDGFLEILENIAMHQKIPLCVIGGIKNLDDAKRAFDHGADKVGINTAGITRPEIYQEIANVYGSQAVVASIEAKFDSRGNSWEALVNSGRDRTGVSVTSLVARLEELGCGEILLTSIDCDGLKNGPDISLLERTRPLTKLPLIYAGGIRDTRQGINLLSAGADAISLNSVLHYGEKTVKDFKNDISSNSFEVRMDCYE
jgi:imidazoleglycerol phosphate synthase cyclase subunit